MAAILSRSPKKWAYDCQLPVLIQRDNTWDMVSVASIRRQNDASTWPNGSKRRPRNDHSTTNPTSLPGGQHGNVFHAHGLHDQHEQIVDTSYKASCVCVRYLAIDHKKEHIQVVTDRTQAGGIHVQTNSPWARFLPHVYLRRSDTNRQIMILD